MQITKEACIARAKQWGHKDGGIVIKAIEASFDPKLPKGTNRMLKFYEGLLGHPYGATDKNIDKKTDCAEMTRVGHWVYIGEDIGNYTDAQYNNKKGKVITENFDDLPKCRPTDLVFYKTSATKKTGHVAVIYDSKHIIHSGASENGSRVGFSAITWGKKYWKKGMCVKRFVSDEQYQALIVGGEIIKSEVEDVIKKGDKGSQVGAWQRALLAVGQKLPKYGVDNDFGSETEAATNGFKASVGLPQNGIVDAATAAAMWDKLLSMTGDYAKVKELQAKIDAAKKALS